MPLEPDDAQHLRAGILRFRWLDRWLEPRWRALLTWVVLAVLAASMLRRPAAQWIFKGVQFTHEQLFAYMPGRLPAQISTLGITLLFILSHIWFPPLLLRLGAVRTIVWIGLGVPYSFLRGIAPPLLSQHLSLQSFTTVTLAFGIPALAVFGRRNRPWMGFVAGGLSAAFIAAWYFREGDKAWKDETTPVVLLGDAILSLIYGALMLYGTDPLPRRPADEHQHNEHR